MTAAAVAAAADARGEQTKGRKTNKKSDVVRAQGNGVAQKTSRVNTSYSTHNASR